MCKRIKSFYGEKFIENESLKELGIKYPMKIEYYKIKEKNENKYAGKFKFGIEIIKKEYTEEKINVEIRDLCNIIEEEKSVDNILEILKRNTVTPIGLNDVITDLLYNL